MVRAKFVVNSITRQKHWRSDEELQTIKLSPVTNTSDPESENSKFWAATPSGSIELGCCNAEAVKQFELGKEYYIDFTKVE